MRSMCGCIGNCFLARDPIRPNSAWKALGVIGPSRSVIKTCEDGPWLPPFAERNVMECRRDDDGLFRLDVGRPDHLAPLLGFLSDELAEVSGRTRKHHAAEVNEPRFHVGIGEASVDLLV
jgi:hypothetical protein